jgi:hypothetical protein
VNGGGRRGGRARAAFFDGRSRLRAFALHESDEIAKSQGPISDHTIGAAPIPFETIAKSSSDGGVRREGGRL